MNKHLLFHHQLIILVPCNHVYQHISFYNSIHFQLKHFKRFYYYIDSEGIFIDLSDFISAGESFGEGSFRKVFIVIEKSTNNSAKELDDSSYFTPNAEQLFSLKALVFYHFNDPQKWQPTIKQKSIQRFINMKLFDINIKRAKEFEENLFDENATHNVQFPNHIIPDKLNSFTHLESLIKVITQILVKDDSEEFPMHLFLTE